MIHNHLSNLEDFEVAALKSAAAKVGPFLQSKGAKFDGVSREAFFEAMAIAVGVYTEETMRAISEASEEAALEMGIKKG